MKKLLYILALAACVLTGCKKDNFLEWKAMNQQWLQLNRDRQIVINDSTYTVRETDSGLQYIVVSDPNKSEAHPGASSTVVVDYQLNLINQIHYVRDAEGRDTLRYVGTPLDQRKWAAMSMGGVIRGFAEGMEKIHTHGDIVLFVPYEIGYGPDGQNNGMGTEGGSGFIPPYSTLIFTIHLCSTE